METKQADITELNIIDCRFEGPNAELFALGKPTVLDKDGKVVIKKGASGVIPYHATFGTINWRNTPMLRAELSYAAIGRFNLENATLSDSQFANAEIGELNLKNVTLAGKLDFANAKVKKVTTENLTRAPGLKLIKDGATLDL